jgi:hypothetical protein
MRSSRCFLSDEIFFFFMRQRTPRSCDFFQSLDHLYLDRVAPSTLARECLTGADPF